MWKLSGLLLIMIGDLLWIKTTSNTYRERILLLEEMLVFVRNVTVALTELNIPLPRAISRQRDNGPYQKMVWEAFSKNQDVLTPREALRSAVGSLSLLPKPAKRVVMDYFLVLGTLQREQGKEYYKAVQASLEESLSEQKTKAQKSGRITAPCVLSASIMAVILLW